MSDFVDLVESDDYKENTSGESLQPHHPKVSELYKNNFLVICTF